ncbi:MAG: alanine:cation symporter family protein, partial [Clostridia bacterium]|nr:alanine:cation symporter family protein [Clostridia bacterium]
MELLETINGKINDFVWGPPTIILILLVGIYLTVKLGGVQFRNWGFLINRTYVKAFKDARAQEAAAPTAEGEITPFQAAMASVSAVVGTGNVAGVATAIVAGGPGALFWMMVAALVGMATKFAEIALGLKYREKADDGTLVSGPFYYCARGLKANWLGKIVAVLFLFFSIFISAVVDTNSMADAVHTAFGVPQIITGVVVAILTAIVIFGGIKRIGEVCGILAPFMAGLYLIFGILIIILHITEVPAAIAL